MYLRISSATLTIGFLAACGSATETPEPEGDAVECAIGAGSEFSAVCTLEEVSGSEFIIHHPDGGFRRFTKDDGIAVKDGAQDATISTAEGALTEIEVDGDRYRLSLPPHNETE